MQLGQSQPGTANRRSHL